MLLSMWRLHFNGSQKMNSARSKICLSSGVIEALHTNMTLFSYHTPLKTHQTNGKCLFLPLEWLCFSYIFISTIPCLRSEQSCHRHCNPFVSRSLFPGLSIHSQYLIFKGKRGGGISLGQQCPQEFGQTKHNKGLPCTATMTGLHSTLFPIAMAELFRRSQNTKQNIFKS